MTSMKKAFFSVLSLAVLLLVAGCANQQTPGKSDDRLSGRAGVNIMSSNMSRVAPTTRPDTGPAAN